MTHRSRFAAAAFAVLSALLPAVLSNAAAAETYPSKPIRLILPFTTGGATDVMARALGEKLRTRLGQPIIVENKPGAGTMLASQYVAKSPADGYTLLMAASSLGIAPAIYSKVDYDPIKDFTPVTLVASVVHVLEVNASLPVKSVKELVDYLKANPDKLSYGSTGSGTSTHLEAELFKSMAGVKMTHIPYKGSSPALTDLVGGQIEVMFDAYASSGPFIKQGKLRALAVTTAKRSATAPDLPTVAESGLPGYEAMPWLGLVAPAGTPAPIVARLHREVGEVLKDPEIRARFKDLGLDIVGNTPEEFAHFIRQDVAKWARVVKESGAKAD